MTLVDLPDVTADVMARVLTAALGEGRSALVRARLRRACPVTRSRSAATTGPRCSAEAHGDRGARDYLQATAHRVVECGDLASGRDLDTPEDLDRG